MVFLKPPMKRFLIVFVLLCCSCSASRFALDKAANVTDVGIYLKMDEGVPEAVQNMLAKSVDDFLVRHNRSGSRVRAVKSSNPRTATLTIHVFETKLVSEGQQVAGALVSLAGLSLPFVMIGAGAQFAVFFYYFPRATSIAELSLSNDIALNDNQLVPFQFSSPGFLKSEQRQLSKHGEFFTRSLTIFFMQMERSLK